MFALIVTQRKWDYDDLNVKNYCGQDFEIRWIFRIDQAPPREKNNYIFKINKEMIPNFKGKNLQSIFQRCASRW